jgi:hypothetical protein
VIVIHERQSRRGIIPDAQQKIRGHADRHKISAAGIIGFRGCLPIIANGGVMVT